MHCIHSYRSLSEYTPWREFNHEIPDATVDTFQSKDWLTDSYFVNSSLSHKMASFILWEDRALSSSKLWTCRIKRWKRTGEGVERGREERGEGRRKEGESERKRERKKEEELEHCASFSKGIEAHRPSPPLLLNFHGKWADRAVLGLWKSESGGKRKARAHRLSVFLSGIFVLAEYSCLESGSWVSLCQTLLTWT